MAGLANNFSVACPNCKKVDEPWYPGTQQKQKKINQKKTSSNSVRAVDQ